MKSVLPVLALPLALLCHAASADFVPTPPLPPPGLYERGAPPPAWAGLELSDAQDERIFDLVHAQAPALHKLERARRKTELALLELARAPRFDETQARSLAEQLGQQAAAIALLHARTAQQIEQILTPEQRAARPAPRQHGMPPPPMDKPPRAP